MKYVLIVYAQNNKESEIHTIVVNSTSLESCYKTIKNIKKDRLNITSYSIYENSKAVEYCQ